MAENELSFEGFLQDVDPVYRPFTVQTHERLTGGGCKLKLQLAKSGYVVSYTHGKSKRTLINFVFRKGGLVARIYGDNINSYEDILASLPESMSKAIQKSPVCKLCNARCPKGYSFSLDGERLQKCRYSCFMFAVDGESIPFITDFIDREAAARAQ